MDEGPSVTTLIAELKQGDHAAAADLWTRYFDKLVNAARKKLGSAPQRAYGPEDIALSVFDSLCRGAERGNFSRLTDREDLWALLLAMTRQHAVDRIRYETRDKRGGGDVRGESIFAKAADGSVVFGIDQLVGGDPTPEFLVDLQEQYKQLLDILKSDSLRKIAVMRLEGQSVKEIAAEFGYTTRWAQRKLELIKRTWLKQIESP